jgi:hypothetical protein
MAITRHHAFSYLLHGLWRGHIRQWWSSVNQETPAMTLSLSSVAASSPSAAVDQGTRIRALAAVLRDAPQADAEVLLAGLARMLDAHIGRGHDDVVSNRRIRDQLDNIELLMALEIERAGVRHTPVPTVSRAA